MDGALFRSRSLHCCCSYLSIVHKLTSFNNRFHHCHYNSRCPARNIHREIATHPLCKHDGYKIPTLSTLFSKTRLPYRLHKKKRKEKTAIAPIPHNIIRNPSDKLVKTLTQNIPFSTIVSSAWTCV